MARQSNSFRTETLVATVWATTEELPFAGEILFHAVGVGLRADDYANSQARWY